MFGKLWTLLGARVLGGAASLAAGWVFAKSRGTVQLDPQQIVEVAGTMITTYAVAHRAASVKINPGDAASNRMANADKDALATGTSVKPQPPQ